MYVRNFFTKATSDYAGCCAFFDGSVLGFNAHFRGHFDGSNDFFYVKIVDGIYTKPFIRARYYPCHWGIFLLEVEIYNPVTKGYEILDLHEKDRKFLIHVLKTSYAVIMKAYKAWRNAEIEVESIPY